MGAYILGHTHTVVNNVFPQQRRLHSRATDAQRLLRTGFVIWHPKPREKLFNGCPPALAHCNPLFVITSSPSHLCSSQAANRAAKQCCPLRIRTLYPCTLLPGYILRQNNFNYFCSRKFSSHFLQSNLGPALQLFMGEEDNMTFIGDRLSRGANISGAGAEEKWTNLFFISLFICIIYFYS